MTEDRWTPSDAALSEKAKEVIDAENRFHAEAQANEDEKVEAQPKEED
jgi:hypothetical protein